MLVTVAIPTLNAGRRFRHVLASLEEQVSMDAVLVIDSGSTDETVQTVREMGARLYQIPNSSFGHGRTRNLAVDLSDTEFIAFLTQDARPLPGWLSHLLRPFELHDDVAATFGRQHPRPRSAAHVRRELADVERRLGPPDGVVLRGRLFTGEQPSWATQFFTSVTSAVRRSALQAVPFRDVQYAEDQALVADLHAHGYLTAYAPLAVVEHSHEYPIATYFRRAYDDAVGLRHATGRGAGRGVARHLGAVLALGTRDAVVALSAEEPMGWRLRSAAVSPIYEASRRLAIALASSDRSQGLARALSLETRRRRGL